MRLNWLKLIASLIAVSLLTSCGAGPGYYRNVKTWIGYPVEELKASWGEPEKVDTDSKGRQRYSWTFKKSTYVPPTEYDPPDRSDYPEGFDGDSQHFKDTVSYDAHYDPGDHDVITTCTSTAIVGPDGLVADIKHNTIVGAGVFSLSDCLVVPSPPARGQANP